MYIVGGTDIVYQYTLGTAWDVSTAVYASKSFSVGSQDTNPTAVTFSSDGTKMYIVGYTNDTVYQYTLSTAWNLSTASYASKSFSVTSQDDTPVDLFFSDDVTKMYMLGTTADTVFQYTLSTAWDVSTASYASKSRTVGAQDTSPTGLAFSTDGTKMYMVGTTNGRVFQYTLSTAWDLSTATYASKSFLVTSQETNAQALYFKSDGSKMYVLGVTQDRIYEYNLSTAWDVSTAVYSNVNFSIIEQETSVTGLFFKSDGTKFFIVGTGNKTVYAYDIP
jgi:sugar lactone lactonase YvrE